MPSSSATPKCIATSTSTSTPEFQHEWMNIGTRRFLVRTYEKPNTHPSATSSGKSLGARCANPKMKLENTTAPGAGSHFVSEANKNPLKTDKLISVFLPTTPNPTSGYLLFIPQSDITYLDMTVEDAAKLVISAGLVYPKKKK